MLSNMTVGVEKVRTKIDRKRTKVNATQIIEGARVKAAYIVAHHTRETGSKMLAYERAAQSTGATVGWLRKFIGRCPDVRPDLVTGMNINEAYRRLCSRVERWADEVRAEAAQMREQIDNEAIAGGFETSLSAIRAETDQTEK